MLNVSIYRYNPEVDSEPYMQDFKVDTQGKDVMVLDVLEKLKTEDPTLTFRRSCREGVCGSDGVNISLVRTVWPVLRRCQRRLRAISW